MNDLLSQLQHLLDQLWHPLTLSCLLVVLGGAIALILLMWQQTRWAMAALNALKGSIPNAQVTGPGAALSRARLRELGDGRSLLAERPDHLLEEWLQLHVLRLARFEAGAWITGGALFFTFFLIAWVLTNDVGPAIGGAGSESMVSLSSAVRTMGAKFVVSMAGIFMSIVHGSLRTRFVRLLHLAAAEAAHRLRTAAVSVQDFQVECSEKQVEQGQAQLVAGATSEAKLEQLLETASAIHRALSYQHAENAERVDALRSSIEKLQSIEVSVQDIGTSLSLALQQTVKKDIVEGIRRELQEVVDGLQAALAESFSTTLNTQISAITEELRKIENAVASQAHSQVEDLLHKLSDAISGGFATESMRMKDALSRFGDVVPLLEAQVRSLSRSASEDLAQRTADSTRASELLFERLGRVVESIEKQQQGAFDMGHQMQRLVQDSQSSLASSLATASEQLTHRSRGAVEELTEAMRTATGSATEVYRSLVGEIDASAKLLHQARSDASEGASRLGESSALMRESLQRMGGLVTSVREIAESLGSSVQQARTTVETGSVALKSSTESVQQHQRFIEELASRWPTLTRQYLDASDQAFNKVAGAWKTQAESIGSSVKKIGEAFQGSAVEFSEAVQDLGAQVSKLRGDGPPPAPPRTRG